MKVINEKAGALKAGDKVVLAGTWYLILSAKTATENRKKVVNVLTMQLGGELAGKTWDFTFPANRNMTVHCKCIDEHDDAREFDG